MNLFNDFKITGFERQSGVIFFLLRKLKTQVQMAHLTLGFFWNLLNEIPIEIQWDHNSNSKYNWDYWIRKKKQKLLRLPAKRNVSLGSWTSKNRIFEKKNRFEIINRSFSDENSCYIFCIFEWLRFPSKKIVRKT